MTRKRILLLALWTLVLITPFSASAQATPGDCDGTPGDDVINCTVSPVNPDAIIHADLGNDQITLAADYSADVIYGDGITTSDGFAHGSGGNDRSAANGNGGDDAITNTGVIEGNLIGDLLDRSDGMIGTAGQDTIVNSGTVVKNIYGDLLLAHDSCNYLNYETCERLPEGAADSITNSGRVDGAIYAEGGDDTVILQNGANGGADNLLLIDGGDGTDTLVLDFVGVALTAYNGTPASGSVVINGQTFQWVNFETVTINGLPPVVTAPTGTISTPYGNPTYTWTDTGAESYELAVWLMTPTVPAAYAPSTLMYWGQGLTDDAICNGSTCSLDPTTLTETARLVNGQYQAWVRRTDGAWNGPFVFTLNAPPPAPLTTLAMTGTDTLRPTVGWTLAGNEANANWFRVYLIPTRLFNSGIYTPTVDAWFSRVDLCGGANGTTCALQSGVDLIDDTAYSLFVQSYGPGGYSVGGAEYGNGWGGVEFRVDTVPNPAIPTNVAVDVRQGRPAITWSDDALATRFYVSIYSTTYNQWMYYRYHEKSGNPALTCNGTTCTLIAEDMIFANGDYTVYVNAEGAGGASYGGTWDNGFSDGTPFNLAFPAPALVTDLTASYAGGTVAFSFTGQPGATWYYVWVGTANAAQTYYLTWHSSEGLNCPNLGTCTLNLPLALPSGVTVYGAVQSAGPGGWLTTGGLYNNGFQVSDGFAIP